ncbi:fatty acid desaturase [Ancylobacter defluvii]|uniref:Aminotransferase n=1 Tax=Ancylobacter defluvii TaxID=1282440 RepID=A0A9W6ND34_9HYPH|nr:fatty acid desaturase [Ancylobacter defluvii]MBS7586880.1 fatty acid desaturase [Ancylobacter defluvii]GLK86186.1 aminotransferase [Ancylobacter defluvii]
MSIIESLPQTRTRTALRAAVEWPTLSLSIAIYGGWGLLTFFHASLPVFVLIPLGAWIIAWQGSLQHEIIHGHPTRWRVFNRVLGSIPLSLWLPFQRYRMLHLCHHRDERLTDPLDDPESYYWTEADWTRLGSVGRWLVKAQTRLVGRLVIGPFWSVGRFLASEAKAMLAGDRLLIRIWAHHLAGCVGILLWLVLVCDFDPLAYVLLFLYPGTALQMVRSFAEHKAESEVSRRTAIVENSPVLGLLFLNNNLHAVHHTHPTLPWYRLPDHYRANRAAVLEGNGGLLYRGYGDVFRRFLVRPHDQPEHPHGRAPLDQ